jgi:TatD DNase family protein
VTFKKWDDDDLIRAVPDDRLLVESDSPYLAPVPNRGRRNEPAWVSFTVARVALARQIEPDKLAAATRRNTIRLFGLSIPTESES